MPEENDFDGLTEDELATYVEESKLRTTPSGRLAGL